MIETVTLRAPEVRTFAALTLRDVDSDKGGHWLEGRAVPYSEWANIGWFLEEHEPGSFARSIAEAANGLPLLLWHDNRTYPIGAAEQWRDDKGGLDGVWKLDGSDEARRASQLARDGMLTGLSVGFVPLRSAWKYVDDKDWDPDLGPEHMDRVTRQESRLLEVSLTPTPAFAGAQVSLVRSREGHKRARRNSAEVAGWSRYRESIRRKPPEGS